MSKKTTKQRLIKRLTWYFQVEGMNVVMFFGIFLFLNTAYGIPDLLFLSYGLLLMCFVLAQGTYYWWTKLSVLQDKDIFEQTVLSRFRKLKRQNLCAIALIPVILAVQWSISGGKLGTDNFLGWAIFANIFGILEHINYYHRQLMIDNIEDVNYVLHNRKLKEASLFKDLRENKI